MEKTYNVYKIDCAYGYHGFALVGAETAEEANQLIKKFKAEDNDGWYDSEGFLEVKEPDKVSYIFSSEKGIHLNEISRNEEWSWGAK